MPSRVYWVDEDVTIICQEMIGDWTIDEYISSSAEVSEKASAQPHTVHIVGDWLASGRAPLNLSLAASRVNSMVPSNVGMIMLIVNNPLLLQLARATLSLVPAMKRQLAFLHGWDEVEVTIQRYERFYGAGSK